MRRFAALHLAPPLVAAALGDDRTPGLLALDRRTVPPDAPPHETLTVACQAFRDLTTRPGLAPRSPLAIGVAFGGALDPAGVVVAAPGHPAWGQFPLRQSLEVNLGPDPLLLTDAQAAACSEPAPAGDAPLVYIVADASIRGALVDRSATALPRPLRIGQLRTGAVPLRAGAAASDVDAVAGVAALLQRTRASIADWNAARDHAALRLQARHPSARHQDRIAHGDFQSVSDRFARLLGLLGNDLSRLSLPILVRAADTGDRLSRDVLADAVDTLAAAIVSLITLLGPERVVIGGPLAAVPADLFLEPLRANVRTDLGRRIADRPDIVLAQHPEDAPLHGLAHLLRTQATNTPPLKPFAAE